MKRLCVIFALFPLFTSCFSYYPAMSEKNYQNMITELSNKLEEDGFKMTNVNITTNDDKSIENYIFSNNNGGELEFNLDVVRKNNNGYYIEDVNVVGCKSLNCPDQGICGKVQKVIRENQVNDVDGKKFSVGKTVGAAVGGIVGTVGVIWAVVILCAFLL